MDKMDHLVFFHLWVIPLSKSLFPFQCHDVIIIKNSTGVKILHQPVGHTLAEMCCICDSGGYITVHHRYLHTQTKTGVYVNSSSVGSRKAPFLPMVHGRGYRRRHHVPAGMCKTPSMCQLE